MKNFLIGLFTFIGTTGISAQTQSITVHSQTTGKEEIIDVPESMQSEMDSLYWDWQSKNHITLGENCTMASTNPVVSDSIYMDRLSRIPSIIEMPYNEAVRKFIDMYAVRLRNKVSFMLAATNFYMPIFEEALDLFRLPRELGEFEEKVMTVAVGRFGAYIRHNSAFYSLPKTDDPLEVTAERAIEIIIAKREADKNKIISTFGENGEIQVLNGRFGPYIAFEKNNYKIPKKIFKTILFYL